MRQRGLRPTPEGDAVLVLPVVVAVMVVAVMHDNVVPSNEVVVVGLHRRLGW
jgi:hypothetical protein